MAGALADVWIYFADTSCRGYSPLYDRICRTVAVSDDVLELVGQAPPRGHQPNVLLGAVHFLLLGGLLADAQRQKRMQGFDTAGQSSKTL